MLIDKGFFVDNFVGTYEMVEDEELGCTLIVSKEFNHADESIGEKPLQKKRIFEFDTGDDHYIFLDLANVDILSPKSILSYCNQYGLPYSSQLCYDNELGIRKDIEDDLATYISKREAGNKYARQDTIDCLEFCRHAVRIRSLVELKDILNRKTSGVMVQTRLIPLLIYLLLYNREFVYDYDLSDYERPEILPKTRLMNFQFWFHLFRRGDSWLMDTLTPAQQVVFFIQQYKYFLNHPDQVKDPMVLSHMRSEDNLKTVKILEKMFIDSPKENIETGQKPRIVFDLDLWKGRCSIGANAELLHSLKHTKNQFSVDEYGRVTFSDKIDYTGDISELFQLSFEVIRDVINEGLSRITPEMILEDSKLRGTWFLEHQMAGIYMELFSQLADDAQYRLCKNPPCRKFFSVSRTNSNKEYCCKECGNADRQRRRRAKKGQAKETSRGEFL